MEKRILLLFAVLILLFHNSYAEQLASDEQVVKDAISSTQNLMNDPNKRNEVLSKDSKAKAADDFAKNAVGSENLNEIYAIAADILPALSKKANGDPAMMQQLLSEMLANPNKFSELLTPEQKQKISELSKKSPQNKNKP